MSDFLRWTLVAAWCLACSQICTGKLFLVNSTVLAYNKDSMGLVFVAFVRADGKDENLDGNAVRLEAISCCQLAPSISDNSSGTLVSKSPAIEKECDSIAVHSGLAHRVRANSSAMLQAVFLNRVYLYQYQYLINRKGSCRFRIHNSRDIKPFEIAFDTSSGILTMRLMANETKSEQSCAYVDQDPLKHCEPVNCVEKYRGYRSHFNNETGNCEPTPECTPERVGTALNISELKHEEHHPTQILDLSENKCRNLTGAKNIKPRSVQDDRQNSSSAETFEVIYGHTLTKLAVAFIFSIIFLFLLCIACNFLFGSMVARIFFVPNNTRKNSKAQHKPLPYDKSGTKYSKIVNEDEAYAESASKVIEEVKDRREMKSGNFQKPGEPRKTSNDEMGGTLSFWPSRSSTVNQTSSNPQVMPERMDSGLEKSPEQIESPQISNKLSNASLNMPNRRSSRLSSELSRAFGGVVVGHRQNIAKNVGRGQPSPKQVISPSSQLINVGSPPVIQSVIHKIQEESGGSSLSSNNHADTRPSSRQPTIPKQQRYLDKTCLIPQPRNVSVTSSDVVNVIETDRLSSRVNFSHWANMPSNDSVHRLYKAEMTQAANFLRELEQSGLRNGPQSPDIAPCTIPARNQGFNATAGVMYREATEAVQTAMEETGEDCRPTFRRIQREAPIPLSMIHSRAKIGNFGVSSAEEVSVVEASEQQSPDVFVSFATPCSVFTSPPVLMSPSSSSRPPKTCSNVGAHALSDEITARTLNEHKETQTSSNEHASDIRKNPVASVGVQILSYFERDSEVKEIPVATTVENEKTSHFSSPLSRKVYESGIELQKHIMNSPLAAPPLNETCDKELDFSNKSGSCGRWNYDSQMLIHSPSTLSTSDTSCETNGSDFRYEENAREACFFDNDLVPVRTTSASDEVLQTHRWIDSFKTREPM